MGNDISKKDNIDEDFKQKSNLVIEELDSFFGPIQGFFFKTSEGKKTEIKGLDERYAPEFSQDVIDKIKEERNVCNNIIGTYKNSLNGLLKDKVFSQRVNSFIKNKKLDVKNFDINIRITTFKEEPAICDRVLEYYWMKYLVYRMLRNLDPLAEEYALIEKFTKSPRWANLFDQNYEEANKIKKDLDQQRDRVRGLINQNMTQLLQDNLTYDDLMKLYKNLVEDKKLQSYAEEIYNICENLADLELSSNPKAYKLSRRGKLKGINLQNYKQVKICERLKTRSKGAPVPPPKPLTLTVPPPKPLTLIPPKPLTLIGKPAVNTRGRGIPVAVDTTIHSKFRNPKSILKNTTYLKKTTTGSSLTKRVTLKEKVKNKTNEIRDYLNKGVKGFLSSVNNSTFPQETKTELINIIETFKNKCLDQIKEIEDDKFKNNSTKLDLLSKEENNVKSELKRMIDELNGTSGNVIKKSNTTQITDNEKVKNKTNEIRNYLNKGVQGFIFSVNKTNSTSTQKTEYINIIEKFKNKYLDQIKEIEDDKYKNNSTKLDLLSKKENDVKSNLNRMINALHGTSGNTEKNLDQLNEDANNLSLDMYKYSSDIDEEYDSDWKRHEKEYDNINSELRKLQDAISELGKQDFSDFNKQQAIDTYRRELENISKIWKQLKKELQDSKPAPSKKTVMFNLD